MVTTANQQKSENGSSSNRVPNPTPDGGSRGVQPKTPLGPKPPRPTPPPRDTRGGSIASELRGDSAAAD